MRRNRHRKSSTKVNKTLSNQTAISKDKLSSCITVKDDEIELVITDPKINSDSFNEETADKSKSVNKEKLDKIKGNGSNKKCTKKKDNSKGEADTDSEEERWLDAIESGKLEEVDDELKRMKNPHLMTARQRAMMEKRLDVSDDYFSAIPAEPLLALPSGFKEKVFTEEMLAKNAIKTKRRREQAQERREEDKKKTVDRLLKKQDCRNTKAKQKISKKDSSFVTYVNGQKGIYISFPPNMHLPIATYGERKVPKPVFCGVRECNQLKKYSCSKTGTPLCSLQCYKINLDKCARYQL